MPPQPGSTLRAGLLRLVVGSAAVMMVLSLATVFLPYAWPLSKEIGGSIGKSSCTCSGPLSGQNVTVSSQWPWQAATQDKNRLSPWEVQRKLGYSNNGRIAVVYIGNKPALETVEFAADIASNCLFDVYVVADDNSYVSPSLDLMRPLKDLHTLPRVRCTPGKPRHVALLQYDEKIVVAHNVTGMGGLVDDKVAPTGRWEKTMHALFNEPVVSEYAYYVLIDEETFVPSVRALEKLVTKQVTLGVDFASATVKVGDTNWPFWTDFERAKMPKPWYQGMVNFVAFSDKYLHKLRLFHQYWNRLFFLESMFNTVAETSLDLRVNRPAELVTVEYHAGDRYSGDDVQKYIDNMYYPVRSASVRKGIREYLKKKNLV